MGVFLYTDAYKGPATTKHSTQMSSAYGGQVTRIGKNFLMNVLYDNSSVLSDQAALPATERWLDGSGLYRIGLNIGPTFQNVGTVNVALYGSTMSSAYAHNVTAARITEMSSRWVTLSATLAPGAIYKSDSYIYGLFRLVFTAGGAGSVRVLTL